VEPLQRLLILVQELPDRLEPLVPDMARHGVTMVNSSPSAASGWRPE
jgi:hypothetical protein